LRLVRVRTHTQNQSVITQGTEQNCLYQSAMSVSSLRTGSVTTNCTYSTILILFLFFLVERKPIQKLHKLHEVKSFVEIRHYDTDMISYQGQSVKCLLLSNARISVLRIRNRDLGSSIFLSIDTVSGSGMGKKSGSGIRDGKKIRIRDKHPWIIFSRA
jgi:hypothetical protein